MIITKTDYLEYTFCKKNLWLKKHKPELFEDVRLSEFEKKIISEGNDADEGARNLFPDGKLINIVGINAVPITEKMISDGVKVLFQAGFLWKKFFIQADIFKWNDELEGWELYEVKATNSIKRKVPHHHVNDLAFQKIVIEGAGFRVVKTGVIHLNGEYRMHSKVDYNKLFIVEDLTREVLDAEESVKQQMQDIKTWLSMPEDKGCECLYRGRSSQCTTFSYSNPQVPEYSVHDMNRIGSSKKLLYDWIDRGVYAIEDIDNPEKLTGAKKVQYDAYMLGKPIIDHEGIESILKELDFPLYFFDYEGYSSAIPRFMGFGAYEQVPFQYSLHVLEKDGELTHKEFLIREPKGDFTLELVKQMRADIGDVGSIIVWHKQYESERNTKLAELHPEYADFLEGLNERIFDLKEIFSKNLYVDKRFKGSASIKNVLPVIVPELTYKVLGIQKGDQAVERWEKMIDENTPPAEKRQIADDLLEYCELDTYAMVEIYNFLKKRNA